MANTIDSPHGNHPVEAFPEPQRIRPEGSNGHREIKPHASNGKSHPHSDAPLSAEWTRVRELAMKQLNRCVSLEPKVLKGDDPDAIHDLRVATRRLQQAIDLMYPTPRPNEIRKLRRRLKRCRSALSEVRNCDVLLERVDASLARKRTAHRQAWNTVHRYLRDRRKAMLEKALRKLTGANLSEIYVRMKDFLLRPEEAFTAGAKAGQRQAENPAARQFYSRISENLNGVWETLEEQIDSSERRPDAAGLHGVRIATKRFRYLVEILQAFEVPGSPEVLVWLRSLQKHLGHWHDLVVFEEAVIEMIADPDFLRDHLELALDIERLILKNRTLQAKFEEKYREVIRDQAGLLRAREWAERIMESPSEVFAPAA